MRMSKTVKERGEICNGLTGFASSFFLLSQSSQWASSQWAQDSVRGTAEGGVIRSCKARSGTLKVARLPAPAAPKAQVLRSKTWKERKALMRSAGEPKMRRDTRWSDDGRAVFKKWTYVAKTQRMEQTAATPVRMVER